METIAIIFRQFDSRVIRVKRIQSPTPPFEALGAHKQAVIEVVLEHIARELGKPVEDIRSVNYYGTDDRNTTLWSDGKDNIIAELTESLERHRL